ncbi:MAG: hypothetical protein M0R50_10030, partial [Candidatus Cloacimonetes bacterium]|nr:hypothetical protein [Candidatus Cloacimonadota bacterium]
MKKIALLSVLFALVVIVSLSAGTSRTYVQRVVWENGEILDLVTNTGSTHNENFIVTADIEETVGEVLGTNLATPISSIRLCKTGNGTIVPYYAAVFLQLGTFTTQWVAGQTINMSVTYVPTGAVANWSIVIPAGTTSILMTGEGQEQIVPGPPSTHTITGTFTSTNWNTEEVTINTTTPEDVEIQVSGSTYTVTVPDGWTGTITPSKDGYVFDPVSRDYTNVTADIADQDYVVKAYVNPNAPTITAPEAAQVFTFEAATPVTITWTNPAGFMPEYYETKWMEGEWTNAGLVNEWTTAALETGDYTFAVRGVIDTPQAKVYSRVDINGRSLSHANAASPKGAGTEASVSFSVIIYDIVPGNPFAIDTNTNITGSGTGFVGATVEAGDLPPVPNAGN